MTKTTQTRPNSNFRFKGQKILKTKSIKSYKNWRKRSKTLLCDISIMKVIISTPSERCRNWWIIKKTQKKAIKWIYSESMEKTENQSEEDLFVLVRLTVVTKFFKWLLIKLRKFNNFSLTNIMFLSPSKTISS